MARTPSYDFERRERQKAKAAKRAEKTKAKADKKSPELTTPEQGQDQKGSELQD